jgi:membrane-associated phospholipid phosphatase
MTGKWDAAKRMSARYLVPALALIAGFTLDGLAIRTRPVVLAVVPQSFLLFVAEVGNPATVATVVVILFASGRLAHRSRVTRAAVVLASALAVTGLVVLSLKWLASRGPDGVFYGFGAAEDGVMFPSGHTAMAFAACTVIGMVWRNARWPACLVAVGVAVSRATLIHFLSDVVAGTLIGVAVGQGVARWWAAHGFLEVDDGPQAAPASDTGGHPAEQ